VSTARPATINIFGVAALFVAAMHAPVKGQAPAAHAIPAGPSPALTTERNELQCAISGDANSVAQDDLLLGASFEQQCRKLLVAVSSQRPIEFAHASDRLKSTAFSLLDGLVETAADCPAAAISVTGHADRTGDEHGNLVLSKARAESVVAYMVARGIAADRLSSFGAGSTLPLVEDDSVQARAKNRRIEFAFSFPVRK
jgi:outer membrane protein OmpA-like peptidoglycan-associated protein